MHNFIWVSSPMSKFRNNLSYVFKKTSGQTEERKNERTDKPYFKKPFGIPPGVQKEQMHKCLTLHSSKFQKLIIAADFRLSMHHRIRSFFGWGIQFKQLSCFKLHHHQKTILLNWARLDRSSWTDKFRNKRSIQIFHRTL